MKILFQLAWLSCWLPFSICGQGTLVFYNGSAPTRIGSATGPLAGTNVWGQPLVGLTPNSLTPVGPALQHMAIPNPNFAGKVALEYLVVPFAPARTTVYVQLAAWDGSLWGNDFSTVPASGLGYTDIVPMFLFLPSQLQLITQFTQPAIVPVPEPSVLTLALLGGLALVWRVGRSRHRRVRVPSDG